MENKNRLFAALITLVSALPACKEFDVKEFGPPTWEVDLLGPLAVTRMSLEDIQELNGLEFSEEITLAELGIPPGSGYVPAVNFPDLGPYEIHFFDVFYYVDADSISLSVTLENNLPLSFNSGGTLEIRNKYSGEVLYSYTLADTLQKFSSLPVQVVLTNKRIEPDIELLLTDFSTIADSATITPDNSVRVILRLDFISITRASVRENSTILISDTANFNLKGDELDVVSIAGYFNTYINNGFPFSGEMQAYFYTGGSDFLDSLFTATDSPYVRIPDINPATGEVIAPKESKIPIYMDSVRVSKILNSKKVFFEIKLASPVSQRVIADNRFSIDAQMVGDLRVRVEN